MPPRSYIEELEFDLPSKLLEELVTLFEEMPAAQLNDASLESVQEEQGVYQIFMDDSLVYIGKTDSDAGLRKRLSRHATKIKGRRNLDVEQVTFKAIRVFVFTAMDLEQLLIKYYQQGDRKLAWQHSGFGANDPGRQRDTSKVKEDHFDAMHPINLEWEVQVVDEDGVLSAAELLQELKAQLPYNIRFARGRGRRPHTELESTQVRVQKGGRTVRQWLKDVKGSLGAEWQITALPGYIIVYKEKAPQKYPSGTVIQ